MFQDIFPALILTSFSAFFQLILRINFAKCTL